MESAASGIVAGLSAVRMLQGREPFVFPRDTMIGALTAYVSDPAVRDFQPMGANFGILPPLEEPVPGQAAAGRGPGPPCPGQPGPVPA